MSSTARSQTVFRVLDDVWQEVQPWRVRQWIVTRGPLWATSVVAHAVVLSLGLLLVGTVAPQASVELTEFESQTVDTEILPELECVDLTAELAPSHLDTTAASEPAIDLVPLADSLHADDAADAGGDPAQLASDSLPGGGNSFAIGAASSTLPQQFVAHDRSGPGVSSKPGPAGRGAAMNGFNHRTAHRSGVGQTKAGDRAVARALKWLSRHQDPDGSWSLQNYAHQCDDPSCTAPGSAVSDSAATALGLLPFLAAGQTHRQKGPYAKQIYQGLSWLVTHQKPDGDLSAGSSHRMYSHGLATIALAEAAGMTRDAQLRAAAQQAVKYIEAAQNKTTGGWRYQPGDRGDTSVVGWQVMALKSAQMAGLAVDSVVLERASEWLRAAATAEAGRYAYEPGGVATPTLSAVGLLAAQYLGAQPELPQQQGGRTYLLANLPTAGLHNAYYWYYATQVMHNFQGPEWDTWNRKMRQILIQSQANTGCADGSWDPLLPAKDAWGEPGGRLMVTSLNCLTLEVYYRYLPLYGGRGGP